MSAAPQVYKAIKPNYFTLSFRDLSGDSSVIHYLADAVAAEGSRSLD